MKDKEHFCITCIYSNAEHNPPDPSMYGCMASGNIIRMTEKEFHSGRNCECYSRLSFKLPKEIPKIFLCQSPPNGFIHCYEDTCIANHIDNHGVARDVCRAMQELAEDL
jgi:hypothetical protein